MASVVFKDDDSGYVQWVEANRDGYVLNTYRKPQPGYVVLHRATCTHITRLRHGKRWTAGYLKVCSVKMDDLIAWSVATVGRSPGGCGDCWLGGDYGTGSWHLTPGDEIKRTELHDRYGGRRQGGIGPSAKTPNVFVFTDPAIGAAHGYLDRWVGSAFHYTGEGQRGDQKMVQGNRAILQHAEDGRAVRVFQGSSAVVTYLGEFQLDPSDPYAIGRAVETGGGPERDVIIFHLVPVGIFLWEGRVRDPGTIEPSLNGRYRRAGEFSGPRERKPTFIDPDVVDRGTRGHRHTQDSLADFVADAGHQPRSPVFGDPKFDVGWWDGDHFVVAEVKSVTDANEVVHLRLGLGQVLDYVDVIRRSGHRARAVLALERAPRDDRWLDLSERHGVIIAWPGEWERAVRQGPE